MYFLLLPSPGIKYTSADHYIIVLLDIKVDKVGYWEVVVSVPEVVVAACGGWRWRVTRCFQPGINSG
jgi:hypothetical protein